MNWFKKYKMANSFYNYASKHKNIRVSSNLSTKYKKTDLSRWGKLHEMLADELGMSPEDPYYFDKYQKLATIFCELTDELNHLPRKNEFMNVWQM